jgi:hypothetical protein
MLKKCGICNNDFQEIELSKVRGWCCVCKKEQIRLQKLKCYHKNKNKYKISFKGTDEKSRKSRRDSYHKNKHKYEYNYLSGLLTKIKSRAKKFNRDFNLTKEFIENLYFKQNGCCAVTAIPFSNEKYNDYKRKPFAPSLDRIDSKMGYTQDNVRFVCSMVNAALGEFGDKFFDKMCRAYVENTILSR